MERIIVVTGGNRRAVKNYTARSLACSESYPASPFWLALLSPSERLLCRISSAFKFDPRVQRACLSRHRQPSCEDFGEYLFIQTSLLEPSRKNLFIQQDIKIILSREYLITLHKSKTPLYCSLSGPQVAELTRTGALLLALFENSTANLIRSFCSARNIAVLPVQKCEQPTRNPLWWRLRNFRGALLRDARLLHGIAALGDRFFSPSDRSFFESIRAKIYLLSDVTNRLLLRMDPPAEVPLKRVHQKIS
jgi:CorA-like Mg2+ transporter protein